MKYNLEPQQMPVIAIDFDGVIVRDAWPYVGEEIPGAIETINQWYDDGYWIIINTCRTHVDLDLMVSWLNQHGVKHHTVNTNLVWRIYMYDTDPRKIGADIYIDDHNVENIGREIGEYTWELYREMVYQITKMREAKYATSE